VKLWANEESRDNVMVFTEEPTDVSAVTDIVWPEHFLDNFMPAWLVPKAMAYLRGRRVKRDTARALNILWDLQRGTVCFPVRNWDGDLVGLRGRYLVDSGARYHDYDYQGTRNKFPWYGESTVDLDYPVLMVESVFDYASAYRVYKNILAPLTVGLSKEKCSRVQHAFEVVTLFDNGVGGDKGRSKITQGLPSSVVTNLRCPAGRDDPGDMKKKELWEVLKGHIVLTAK
jgi:hypothetical protein